MKRIYIVMLFAALATITYAQTDDKGYQEGAWVLKLSLIHISEPTRPY